MLWLYLKLGIKKLSEKLINKGLFMTCPYCQHCNDTSKFYQIFGMIIYRDDKRLDYNTELVACPECKKVFIDSDET